MQIYTGNGKGKTTASLGLVIRALGFGTSVYIGQFIKKGDYNEIKMLNKIAPVLGRNQKIKIEQFGSGEFILGKPSEKEIKLAEAGFNKVLAAIYSGEYGLVIADELNVALSMGLIEIDQVLELVNTAKGKCELVVTGRKAHPKLIEIADLVTEMNEIKHYIDAGVEAREGIEM